MVWMYWALGVLFGIGISLILSKWLLTEEHRLELLLDDIEDTLGEARTFYNAATQKEASARQSRDTVVHDYTRSTDQELDSVDRSKARDIIESARWD